jgi:hypothetical protein
LENDWAHEAAFEKNVAPSAVVEHFTVTNFDFFLEGGGESKMQTYYRVNRFTLENGILKQVFKMYF